MKFGSLPPAVRLTANDVWKANWSRWIMRSVLAAAATHAILFIGWPSWEIPGTPGDDRPIELIQINPIAAYGGAIDASEGLVTTAPTEEEIELAAEEARQRADENPEDLAETTGVRPLAAYRVVPEVVSRAVASSPLPPLGQLNLEQMTVIAPEVLSLSGAVSWPQFRNPTVIARFLRSRYNPLQNDPRASGTVQVALWLNERGVVERARVVESSGHPALDNIALDLFEQIAVFAPARSGRSPVPVHVNISVPFMVPW